MIPVQWIVGHDRRAGRRVASMCEAWRGAENGRVDKPTGGLAGHSANTLVRHVFPSRIPNIAHELPPLDVKGAATSLYPKFPLGTRIFPFLPFSPPS